MEREQVISDCLERFRSLFENAAVGIYQTSLDGEILLANQTLIEMLGFASLADLQKRRLDVEGFRKNGKREIFVRLIERDGLVKNLQSVWKTKDGRDVYVLESAHVFKDENGNPLFYEGTVVDVTGLKKTEEALKESELKYRLIAENSADTIWIYDMQLNLTFVSPAVEKMKGFTVEEALSLSAREMMTPDSYRKLLMVVTDRLEQHRNCCPNIERTVKFETEEYCKNGSKILVSNSCTFLHDELGEPYSIVGVSHDITEQKRDELIKTIQYNIAHAVVTANDLEDLYLTVRSELGKVLDTTNFLIAIYDEESGMFSAPFEKDEVESIPTWKADRSMTGYVKKQNRSILATKNDVRILIEADVIDEIGTISESWLGVPLVIGNQSLGVIVIQSYDNENEYDESSVKIVELIANQLSVYIDYKRAQERSKELERKNAILAMIVTANHEISQPLAIIKGNLELMQSKLEDDCYAKYLNSIDGSVLRIEKILRQMREIDRVKLADYTSKVKMLDLTEEEIID